MNRAHFLDDKLFTSDKSKTISFYPVQLFLGFGSFVLITFSVAP